MRQTTQAKLTLIASSLLFTSLISNQANAGWWDDAVSTVKSLGGEEVVEEVIKSDVSNGD